ncbi:hypothetical protein [Microbulbifer sp. ZKSA002]|uniref:hypothetical protein n=1 Tax=Microbulbifer sp. ZKSA002 TaxID=3243388 RepID=UPI00403A4568
MTKNLGILFCRAIAVVLVVIAIPNIAYVLHMAITGNYDPEVAILTLMLQVVVPLFLAVVFFAKSRLLAYLITGGVENDISASETGIVRAGTFLLGLWLLVKSLPELSNLYSKTRLMNELGYDKPELWLENNITLIFTLFLGVCLILGSRVVGSAYTKLRDM